MITALLNGSVVKTVAESDAGNWRVTGVQYGSLR